MLDDLAHLLGDVDESNRDVRVPCSTVRLADALGVARGTLQGVARRQRAAAHRRRGGAAALVRADRQAREFALRERKSLTAAAR